MEGTISNQTIQIQFLNPKIDLSEIKVLIFTSKNGVKAVNQVSEKWKNFPAIVVGEKTEKAVLESGGKILATSSGNGKSLEKLIFEKFREQTFLYFRPEKVALEIGKNLREKGIFVKETIVYKTFCKKSKKVEQNSLVIATSPLSVKCFLENGEVPKNTIFIAIGNTTQKAIPKYFKILVPNVPSLENCFKLAKDYLSNL